MSETAQASPSWAAEAIWWQVYPLGSGALRPLTFVGNHDVTWIASQLSDHRHLGHALAVLFSVGGTPAVYYGDEQGLRGFKENLAGGDDAIRPAYPADPDHLPASGWPVYRLHQQLIAMRRRHPWLAAARTTVAHLTNRAVALQASAPGGGTRVITLLNADDRPYDFPLDLSGLVTMPPRLSGGWMSVMRSRRRRLW